MHLTQEAGISCKNLLEKQLIIFNLIEVLKLNHLIKKQLPYQRSQNTT